MRKTDKKKKESNLEKEREDLLKLMNSNIPPKQKKQIEAIALTVKYSEKIVVNTSNQGAADANET